MAIAAKTKENSKAAAKKPTVKTAAQRTKKTLPTKKKSSAVSYKLKIGDPAPAFSGASTTGKQSSAQLKGRPFVLYFYPKDNTSGCTLEGQDFKRLYAKFQALGAEVIGVSRDSMKSHQNFCEKFGLPFPLLSDENGAICKAFDVIQMKSLYGRKFEGIERSTFIIDARGFIAFEWRKVNVNGHADAVLEAMKSLPRS